jgi:hypothetical protein
MPLDVCNFHFVIQKSYYISIFVMVLFSANEPVKDEEHKVSAVQYRWNGLAALLQECKERIYFLQEKKCLYSEMSTLELILEGCQKWLEGISSSPPAPGNVAQQLEQCRMKIVSVKSHEDSINKIRKWAADLSSSQLAGSDAESINADTNNFLDRWGELMLRYVLLLDLTCVLYVGLNIVGMSYISAGK